MSEGTEPPAAKPSGMQRPEEQIGFALAGVALVAGAATGALNGNVFLPLLALGAASGLVLAVRHRHRVITAVAALVAGVVVPILPVNLLFVGYSGWLVMRTSRAQGRINAARPRRSRLPRRRPAAAGAAPKTSPTSGPAHQPLASRRYTPPKAKPGGKR